MPHTLDVQLAGLRYVGHSVLLVSVVLSNGTPRTLNVVDDSAGRPLFLLDAGDPSPKDGYYGVWLGDMANSLRVNLAPWTSLTNSVWLTNPPPRFRLRVNVRDLAAERRGFSTYRFMGRTLAMELWQWRKKMRNPELVLPASPWVELKDYQKNERLR